MTFNLIGSGDTGTATIIMQNLRHMGRIGLSSFYPMTTDGTYLTQNLGESTKTWGDLYLGAGKKIYVGGQEFVGGAGGQINIVESFASLIKSNLYSANSMTSAIIESFLSANPLTLTLGKAYAPADTTAIYLDQNALLINNMNTSANWTAGTNTPTVAKDTTAGHFVETDGGVSLTKANLNGSVDAYRVFPTFSLTNRNVRFWVYPDSKTNLTKISIVFESSAGNSKTFDFLSAGITATALNHCHCDFDRVDGTANNITITSAGTFVRSNITKIYIGYTTGSAQTLTITFDFLRSVDKYPLCDSLSGGLCLPIYNATTQEDMTLVSEVAYPLSGKYVMAGALGNAYALGAFATTAVFAKLLSGTITNGQGKHDSAGSGAHAKASDFIKRDFMENTMSGKKLYLSATFVADSFLIYDFPNTTSLRIYNPDVATDYKARFKSGDKVVMFKLQNNYQGYQSFYNSTLVSNFKILTLSGDSTYSAPYTTIPHTETNATGGDTSNWYIVRLSVWLKYFVGSMTASEAYTSLTPTIFVPQMGYVFPAQIGGLISWYKADAGVTPSTDGTTLTGWNDMSISGNHLTTITSDPTYQVGIQNSLPAVYFDGNDDLYGANIADTAQPYTIFVVFKPTNWAGGGIQSIFDLGSGSQAMVGKANASTALICGSAGTMLSGDSLVNNTCYLATAVFNGASSTIQANNALAVTGNAGAGADENRPRLGCAYDGTQAYTGYIMEVLIYSSALSSANQVLIQDYLSKKWAVYSSGAPLNYFTIGGVAENQSGEKLCVRTSLTRQDTTNDVGYITSYGGILT